MISFFQPSFKDKIESLRELQISLRISKNKVLEKSQYISDFEKIYESSKRELRKSNIGMISFQSIEDKFLKSKSEFVDFCKKEALVQNKIQKSISKYISQSPDLSILMEYDNFIEESKFKYLMVTLVKGYQNGEIKSIDQITQFKGYKKLSFKDGIVYVKDNRTHYSDTILINDKNEILFLVRNKNDDFEPGKYCLPGGHVDKNENPQFAAKRELEEETGINIEIDDLNHIGDYIDSSIVIHYFYAKFNGEPKVLEEREQIQWEWVNIKDITDKPLLMNLAENLQKIDLPLNSLNPKLIPGIFYYYDTGNLIKSSDDKALQEEMTNIYKDINTGKINKEDGELILKEKGRDFKKSCFYRPLKNVDYYINLKENDDNLEKGLSHKYIRKESDGKGGFNYIYKENGNTNKQENYEVNSNDPYTYKDTNVLVNKKNIRDFEKLKEVERGISTQKLKTIENTTFSSSGFKQLHKDLFGELYDWAGKTRTVNLSNGDVSFAPMRFIEENLSSQFSKISNDIKNKEKFTNEEWVKKAANHFGELIFLHPFREGNGRTTRKFLDDYLNEKEIHIDWDNIYRTDYYKACKLSINKGDNSELEQLFNNHLV